MAPVPVTFLLAARVSPPKDVVELLKILVYNVWVGVVLLFFVKTC